MGKFIVVLFFLPITVMANKIELYYEGFWSHHPFAMTIKHLEESHTLSVDINKKSMPVELQAFLFNDFKANKEQKQNIDHVIYIKELDDNGVLVRELAGGNNILYDLENNSHKELSENEKRLLNNFIKDVSCLKSDFLSYKKIN